MPGDKKIKITVEIWREGDYPTDDPFSITTQEYNGATDEDMMAVQDAIANGLLNLGKAKLAGGLATTTVRKR